MEPAMNTMQTAMKMALIRTMPNSYASAASTRARPRKMRFAAWSF
jgi:hypothetical protein